MGLADALVLAHKVSVTIFVSACRQSSKEDILDATERLIQVRANIIGAVFTKDKTAS